MKSSRELVLNIQSNLATAPVILVSLPLRKVGAVVTSNDLAPSFEGSTKFQFEDLTAMKVIAMQKSGH